MFQKYVIPLLAVAGVLFAVFTVVRGDKTPPQPPPYSDASQSPYQNFVAGSGIVEASTENISIGTHLDGIVARIFVQLGSDVKAGDPLFALDDRAAQADVATKQAAVQVAAAQAASDQYELSLSEALAARKIASDEDLQTKRFAAQKSAAQLVQAQAELNSSETNLELLTVRAPVDGQVLQLKVHLGEFAQVGPVPAGQSPLMMLGGVTPLQVRVDVDENDASKVSPAAAAMGYLRGNRSIQTPLTFLRFEPYVVPKQSLTGSATERVDTRVLQAIYRFERKNLPIFVGQQMDVFIEAGRASR